MMETHTLRCPACQSVLHVDPEQLRVHDGLIRCQQCFLAFNASESHATDLQDDEDSPLHFSSGSPWLSKPQADTPPVEQWTLADKDDPITTALSAPPPRPAHAPEPPPEKPAAPEPAPKPEPEPEPPPITVAPFLPKSVPAAFVPENSPRHRAMLAAEEEARAARLAANNPAPPDESPSPRPWPASVTPLRPGVEQLIRQQKSPAKPGLFASPQRNTLLLASALSLLLLVQIAIFWRADAALMFPGLCSRLGCKVELARNAEEIGITSSDLQIDPKHANRFILNAVLQNRGRRPQQYPHIELTLTNERDDPIVRRVLPPTEWLPHTNVIQPEDVGFAGNSKLSLRLNFSLSNSEDAAGYRLYTFYP